MSLNPYRPPLMEEPAAPQGAKAPSVKKTLVYGGYAGAMVSATVTGGALLFVGPLLAGTTLQAVIGYAMAGAFIGAFGGGLLGLPTGAALALLIRSLPRTRPLVWKVFACVAIFPAVAIIGIAFMELVLRYTFWRVRELNVGIEEIQLFAAACTGVCLAAGTFGGFWLAGCLLNFLQRPRPTRAATQSDAVD